MNSAPFQSLEPMYKEHCYCPCSLRSESEQATCHHSLRPPPPLRCHFSLSFTLSLPFSVLPPAFLLRFVSLFTRNIMRAGSDPMIIITERCSMLTRRLACRYLTDRQTELTGQDCSITRTGRILPQTRKILYQSAKNVVKLDLAVKLAIPPHMPALTYPGG